MNKTKMVCSLFAVATILAGLVSCAESSSIEEAQTAYFATVDGTDADCAGWLDWCIEQGYPQAACEQRNEYCVDGRWVGGDRDGDDRDGDGNSDDPCEEEGLLAERACLEAGGTAEECREAGAEAYEDCSGQ